MNGKNKCRILKEIRKKIAQENNIAFVTSECKYQGDCTGTCPKCEAEVRYLEEQLGVMKKSGKAVAVAGIAAALMVSASACGTADTTQPAAETYKKPASGYEDSHTTNPTENTEEMGEMLPPETEPEWMGEETMAEETDGELVLMGDIPLAEP